MPFCRFVLVACAAAFAAAAAEEEFVFRSDVALARVDAQVVDRGNRAVTGLTAEDFVLIQGGREQEIRNFAREEMPADVLFLLDVSGSMQSHIERLATAADRALRILGDNDRVGIMVFDRGTRVRMPFRGVREGVEREFNAVLQQESFNGGTDVTRGLFDAAQYIGRNARREARRAIVVLTDDQTERNRDVEGVGRALDQSGSVLSVLLAPDAMGSGRWSTGGGGWPSGGGLGGPLGGIILGRRGGSRYPGPVIQGPRTRAAGTAEIAERSGGDALRVDEASALETTLARLRQRYALHYNAAQSAEAGDVRVELTADARRRYPNAQIRFRRVNQADVPASGSSDAPVVVSQAPASQRPAAPADRRRPAVDDTYGEARQGGGWRRESETSPAPNLTEPAPPSKAEQADSPKLEQRDPDSPKQGGWRRVKPGEQP